MFLCISFKLWLLHGGTRQQKLHSSPIPFPFRVENHFEREKNIQWNILFIYSPVSRPIPVSDQLFKDLFEDYNPDVLPMFEKYDLDKIRGNWTEHAVKVEINLSLRQIISVVNYFLLPFGIFHRIFLSK